jgi:hypothetical protein
MSLEHSYQNRTGIGKTGRSDRFRAQTGSNQSLKPLQTGSVRNRFFCLNRLVPYRPDQESLAIDQEKGSLLMQVAAVRCFGVQLRVILPY